MLAVSQQVISIGLVWEGILVLYGKGYRSRMGRDIGLVWDARGIVSTCRGLFFLFDVVG